MSNSIKYEVSEIFASIEGEGKRAGAPCTFIRLCGCNLRCTWCDSMYAVEKAVGGWETMSLDSILEKVKSLGMPYVTVTGGEPLFRDGIEPLLVSLAEDYEVNIETNGSVDISDLHIPYTFLTMDYKLPSSGMMDKMRESNLSALCPDDVLKFVVLDKGDIDEAEKVLAQRSIRAQVFFSPVFGKCDMKYLVERVKQIKSVTAKVQLQLHKYIWNPDARGV